MTPPSTSAQAVLRLRDFPDWLPPMVVKEFRQGLRAPLFVAPFILVHVLAILAVGAEHHDGATRGLFSPFWVVATLVVGLIMPLRGFAALRQECDGGNSALLMLGGLSRWEIVRGKWLVQIGLCLLTFLSLLPYLLVRYFLGGFEIIPNLLMALNVIAMAAGMSGCIIGASGYQAVPLRFLTGGIGAFWVLAGGIVAFNALEAIRWLGAAPGSAKWIFTWYAYGGGLGVQILYAVAGMQLGRAHLKLYLLPYEVSPTRAVIALMIFLPFILLAGSLGSLMYGFPAVLALVIFGMCRLDRPWKPAAGQKVQHVTGLDTGWRPLS